jgi:hypothetical protein
VKEVCLPYRGKSTSSEIPVIVCYRCLNRLRHNPPNEFSYGITCEWLLSCVRVFFKEEC